MSESLETWSTCSGSDSSSYMKSRNSWRDSASFIGHERAKAQPASANKNLTKPELLHHRLVNCHTHGNDICAAAWNAGDFATLGHRQRPEHFHPIANSFAADDCSLDLVALKAAQLFFHSRQDRRCSSGAD